MPARAQTTSPARPRDRSSGPSEIAPGVFVGGWKDATRFDGARFCVLDARPEGTPAATHFPIYDDASGSVIRPNLDRLAEAVDAARAEGRAAIIYCGHGRRRSPLAGAWYLRHSEGIALATAIARVQAARSKAEAPSAWVANAASLEGA